MDEVGGEIESGKHILISPTIIANYMPKNEFYCATSQNHVEMLLPYKQQFTCIKKFMAQAT
jgi:hypothetical protein